MPRGVEHNGVRAGRGGAVFSQPMRERGLCFVRVQCERMAVLGPVWYRMKRFFEVTSFPLYNRARAATPACTHVGSLSLKVNVRPPSSQTLSKKKTRKATHHKSARTNITHSMSHAYTSKAAHAAPSGNNHTPLSHIQGSETPRSVSLSNGTTNVHHRRHSGLFSLLFLSSPLIVTHSLHTADTHT